MNILFIGDIVAGPGRRMVKRVLPEIKETYEVDLVFANAENISRGRGVTPEKLAELQEAGIDFFTGGDHVYWEAGTDDIIDDLPIVVPVNYPSDNPGKRYAVVDAGKKGKVLIISALGKTGLVSNSSFLENPFEKIDEILEKHKKEADVVIVDFHADGTSEKVAMGFYLDGRVDAVVGTHTHVPTADNMLLPQGTLYVSDIGMTGAVDSVLGVKKEIILKLLKTARNQRFEWENTGRKAFRSVLLDTDNKSIIRIDKIFAS